ncbi:hypothetical protein SLE2022_340490 [Rubroshorea leprosula]
MLLGNTTLEIIHQCREYMKRYYKLRKPINTTKKKGEFVNIEERLAAMLDEGELSTSKAMEEETIIENNNEENISKDNHYDDSYYWENMLGEEWHNIENVMEK